VHNTPTTVFNKSDYKLCEEVERFKNLAEPNEFNESHPTTHMTMQDTLSPPATSQPAAETAISLEPIHTSCFVCIAALLLHPQKNVIKGISGAQLCSIA
jgi:hypothetical protein